MKDNLLTVFANARKAGGGIHTTCELAFMMKVPHKPAFTKFLSDCAKAGMIRRVAQGVYESTLTPPDPLKAVYMIVNKVRGNALTYISLESQLSHTGDISQIVMGRLTVMTKGRKATIDTPYGIIEFTHTKKAVDDIMPLLYFDKDVGMYRALPELARADLKACNRNLHMLESTSA